MAYEKFARGLYKVNKILASMEAWFMMIAMFCAYYFNAWLGLDPVVSMPRAVQEPVCRGRMARTVIGFPPGGCPGAFPCSASGGTERRG